MKRKVKWRWLKFIPIGGDESQAITLKDKGFMHLCERFRDHGDTAGYGIHDTKDWFKKYDRQMVIDWSDFRPALVKYTLSQPPEKPSVFQGEWNPSDHSERLRKRVLAAVLREYMSPEDLAADLLAWMSRGREDDLRYFLMHLMHGVGWLTEPPRTPEAASTKPIVPNPERIVIFDGASAGPVASRPAAPPSPSND